MKKLGTIFTLCLLLTFLVMGAVLAEDDGGITYPIMHPDQETMEEWIEAYDNAPRAYIDREEYEVPSPGGSLNLLDHLEYDADQRNQGSCQNCWAWAGTGVMEIALDVQEGVKDRLSVQYINSCQTEVINKPCCRGGWLFQLADFYDATDMAIPWSNTNADWQSGNGSCGPNCNSISTDPNYPITYIDDVTIITQTVDQATAIANIKNVLDQGKGVWFGFYLPDSEAWQSFYDFWNHDYEPAVYDMDQFCGTPYEDGGGHAVLCVGYNDDNPNNSYWIMLNSWGTRPHRPHGLFRIDMDMDYDCTYGSIPAFYWQTLDVTFDLSPRPDLTITGKWEEWLDAEARTYSISYTVKNQGGANASASSTSITIDGSDVLEDPVPPLAVNASYNNTVGPYSMSGDSDNITVCADNDDAVAESYESNNCRTNILHCPPDLVITEKSEQWVDVWAGTYNISYTVKNRGCTNASASNTSITIDGIDVLEDSVPPLAAGASHNNTVGPFIMSGISDNITVCADSDDTVAESDETNNCRTNTLVGPDISIDPTGINVTLSTNTTHDYTLTVGNDGDGELSYDIGDGDCPWLGENPTSGTVGPGASQNITVTINSKGLAGGNYTAGIIITSNDPDENPTIVPVTLHVDPLLMSYNITLSAGWNLVSLPIVPDNTDIADVSAGISANASILSYNTTSDTWLWYIPGNPASTLTTIEDGFGYWFFMNGPDVLEVSGQEIQGVGAPLPTHAVFTGWNLIGFTSTTSMNPASYLASIAGDYNSILGYDAEGETWPWYVPDNPASTLTTMEPGFGYWLWATADGIIVPPA